MLAPTPWPRSSYDAHLASPWLHTGGERGRASGAEVAGGPQSPWETQSLCLFHLPWSLEVLIALSPECALEDGFWSLRPRPPQGKASFLSVPQPGLDSLGDPFLSKMLEGARFHLGCLPPSTQGRKGCVGRGLLSPFYGRGSGCLSSWIPALSALSNTNQASGAMPAWGGCTPQPSLFWSGSPSP